MILAFYLHHSSESFKSYIEVAFSWTIFLPSEGSFSYFQLLLILWSPARMPHMQHTFGVTGIIRCSSRFISCLSAHITHSVVHSPSIARCTLSFHSTLHSPLLESLLWCILIIWPYICFLWSCVNSLGHWDHKRNVGFIGVIQYWLYASEIMSNL